MFRSTLLDSRCRITELEPERNLVIAEELRPHFVFVACHPDLHHEIFIGSLLLDTQHLFSFPSSSCKASSRWTERRPDDPLP